MPDRKSPSLYEILTGNFTGGLPFEDVNEEDLNILSVLMVYGSFHSRR